MIKESKTFVVFLGSPYYNESRYSINEFIDVSKDNDIEEIYYVDIIKDGKEENDIRTQYSLGENNELVKVKEKSVDYTSLMIYAKDILPVPYEDFIENPSESTERTIFNSAYIYVENGVPTIYTDGLPHTTQDYTLLTKDQIKKVFVDFYNKRKTN